MAIAPTVLLITVTVTAGGTTVMATSGAVSVVAMAALPGVLIETKII